MTIAAQCHACIKTLRAIASSGNNPDEKDDRRLRNVVIEELERFSLWVGNIGALHPPISPLSLESRLRDGQELLEYTSSLLTDLKDVANELLDDVSDPRDWAKEHDDLDDPSKHEVESESVELVQEIESCITRLYRMTSLVREAAPTDPFAKALSRDRYHFNEQYDVAHVGQKFPKLATSEMEWLRKRLGRGITQRRRYLSYIQDHRDQLETMLHEDEENMQQDIGGTPHMQNLPVRGGTQLDTSSRPSTYFTKATTVVLDQLTPAMLTIDKDSDPEDDAKSYTTISRSVDGDLDTSAAVKIPKLEDLRTGTKKEIECPFCFRIKRFRNERIWRNHVFSDLRTYVCTFSRCESPYFGDINDWFRHEMDNHRVNYECQLCQRKCFETEEHYLDHMRRRHSDLVYAGEKQALCDLARKSLPELKAQDCPCCTDWPDRLRERDLEPASGMTPNDVIYVAPTVFKRHLASHQEQLALFAVALPSASTEEAVRSMAANGVANSMVSDHSFHSPLAFSSPTSSVADDNALLQELSAEADSPAHLPKAEMLSVKRLLVDDYLSSQNSGLEIADSNDVDDEGEISEHSATVEAQIESLGYPENFPEVEVLHQTQYPAFLQPQNAAKLDEKWNDLERIQLHRFKAANEDGAESSLWAQCIGDEYAARNRYANVAPYQANRVHLHVPEGENDYINASPIKLKSARSGFEKNYIATQGPLRHTLFHFWRMVWCETADPAVIVMLTKTYEQGREKCFQYYPVSMMEGLHVRESSDISDGPTSGIRSMNVVPVNVIGEFFHRLELSDVTVNDLNTRKRHEKRTVFHRLYEGWPDFTVPEGEDRVALLKLMLMANSKTSLHPLSPLIVHDSAGVGRTGTYIALDWLLHELDIGALDNIPEDQDPVVEVITRLRDQRPLMVQSKQQFVFIYDVLRDLWRDRWANSHSQETVQSETQRFGYNTQLYHELFIQKN